MAALTRSVMNCHCRLPGLLQDPGISALACLQVIVPLGGVQLRHSHDILVILRGLIRSGHFII